jgi:hypothetical protein
VRDRERRAVERDRRGERPSARLIVSLAAVTVRPVTEPSVWIVFVPSR